MKRFVFVSMAACCVVLSGCVVHDHHRHPRPRGGHVSLPTPKVVVPVPVVVGTTSPAKHCPPGQAKKGKC
jgi:hypothetical protein